MRKLVIASLSVLAASAFAAEGPPTSADGTISNPTLVENSAIAKAQAVGVITTFMGKGTTECDAEGKNCRSLFGQDDSLDYNSVQLNAQASTGVQAFSFLSGNSAEKMDTNTVSSQVGTLVLACGDYAPKTVSGIAVKLTSCAVTAAGDAKISYKTCTGPARGNPIVKPEKTMVCSTDPAAPNFRPKDGYSCERATCDGEPVGSLNGWSETQTVSYSQAVATSGSDDEKSKNGLGFTFYPALTGGVPASYSADSDNMVAVKIAQTAINNETKMTAVGLRVAFRHKALVTKEMMIQGPSAVPEPEKHSAAWDTILKLNGNALIPQYQQTYAANGSECMQQIQQGIASDGLVSVCDPDYTNESGIRPGALTAQLASEGQACGTTTQCLQEIVNTNTWEETCRADVPLAIRKCTTKQDYELEKLSYVRTKTVEQCIEERASNTYGCQTEGRISSVTSELTCVAKSFRCTPSAQACCSIDIECTAGTSAIKVTYHDCCGATHVTQSSSVNDFLGAGIQFNWNSKSRLRCTPDGNCAVDMTDYDCTDPNEELGYFPNVNTFSFGNQYHAGIEVANSCSTYETAR